MSIGEGGGTDLETMRGRNYPTIRQFTVFLENRIAPLRDLVRRFKGSNVSIVALSIVEATECAFVRLVVSHPEQGLELLEQAGLATIESDLIGVELPDQPQPLLGICTRLLQAEVNIVQAYPLLTRPNGQPAVALMVDNLDAGMETLLSGGYTLLTENDLVADD